MSGPALGRSPFFEMDMNKFQNEGEWVHAVKRRHPRNSWYRI
jgi:hypothetical protein